MMRIALVRSAAIAAVAFAYWEAVRFLGNVAEPWDAPEYWTIAYPFSLLLAAAAGWLLRGSAVRAALLVTFAQLPVLLLHGAGSPMLAMGVAMLAALTVPAMLAAALGGWLRRRSRS